MTCEHGFVVLNPDGPKRLVCKQCNTQMDTFPGETFQPKEDKMLGVIKKFNEGALTLTDTLVEANISLKELRDALEMICVPTIANPAIRVSCPLEIDTYFSQIQILPALHEIREKFFDILSVDITQRNNLNTVVPEYYLVVGFIDSSKQLVKQQPNIFTTISPFPFISGMLMVPNTPIFKNTPFQPYIISPLPYETDFINYNVSSS